MYSTRFERLLLHNFKPAGRFGTFGHEVSSVRPVSDAIALRQTVTLLNITALVGYNGVTLPGPMAACGVETRHLTIRTRKLVALALVGSALLAAPFLANGHCREAGHAHRDHAPSDCSHAIASLESCDGDTHSHENHAECKTCLECNIGKLVVSPQASKNHQTNSYSPARLRCYGAGRPAAPQPSPPATAPPDDPSLLALRATILLI